jgi:hypothetical protein
MLAPRDLQGLNFLHATLMLVPLSFPLLCEAITNVDTIFRSRHSSCVESIENQRPRPWINYCFWGLSEATPNILDQKVRLSVDCVGK